MACRKKLKREVGGNLCFIRAEQAESQRTQNGPSGTASTLARSKHDDAAKRKRLR